MVIFQAVRRVFGLGQEKEETTRRRRRIELDFGVIPGPIFAIGDIHGRVDLLRDAERRIFANLEATGASNGLIILLGDYVDRGPNSAAVLDYLVQPPPANARRIAICGNHDVAFLNFIEDPDGNTRWLDMGGRDTLLSYGIDLDHVLKRGTGALKDALKEAVPQTHIDLLERMPVCVRINDFVFVHAGLRPGIPLDQQSDRDMMWIREPFLTEGPGLPLVVVHGHTPVPEPQVGPGRIGIDTAAVSTDRLSVLKLDRGKARMLKY
ncbi:serine/threonine protein phosphatase [Rhizobiaceae bacterium BDR2-2]|uniref:Serine/threonine protein phosphatase n=1 Tax=Ectorhizobium quercum TaxID=2965071 RepID=A0AAE3N352_9HYPH|nr:metallophosphoesterase family protein [Ectorhizobium quercum]MCX8998430.1 serine/threonine protein phosphatase [Ectorhizobium quercum]